MKFGFSIPWFPQKYVVFDIETCGLDGKIEPKHWIETRPRRLEFKFEIGVYGRR